VNLAESALQELRQRGKMTATSFLKKIYFFHHIKNFNFNFNFKFFLKKIKFGQQCSLSPGITQVGNNQEQA